MSINDITEKIEQLVFDENKIVTYKVLSGKLSVHVNKAKQLLNEYVTKHCAKRKNDLNVYYALSGFQKYNGHQIHKVVVVSKDELEKSKKDFTTLSSVHIYSIQKCSVDECSLYTSDYVEGTSDDPAVFSAIRHPNLKIRESGTERHVESSNNKAKNKALESQASRKTELKTSVPAKKSNALFASWQKKGDVSSEQKDKPEAEQHNSPSPPKNERVQNGSPQKAAKTGANKNNIMNLFSKQSVKSSSKATTRSLEKCVVENNAHSSDKEETKDMEVKSKQIKSTSKNKDRVQMKRPTSKRSHKNSDNESDDDWEKPIKKKHKRIVSVFSDSESDSAEEEKDRVQRNVLDVCNPAETESNGIEAETERNGIEVEVDEEPIPPTPPVSVSNEKRRKLKLVNKTFEDEDGFLVTQKVKEYVTDSDGSDAEAPTPVKAAPKVIPKPVVKQNFVNKKQASLMSFFKQK